MQEWTVDTPWGVITPYWLLVEGKWRLADVIGPFFGEYVTCPFCENQKGLVFETDSTRLGEMCDITCPRPCGKKFQLLEITGYDLKQRLAFLAGEETDPAWEAKIFAEDPSRPSGPLPPASDEPAEPPAEPKASPAAGGTAEPRTPRMRTARGRSRVESFGVIVGPGERVDGPVRVTTGSTTGKSSPAARKAARKSAEAVSKAVADAVRPAPGTRVYRNDGVVNTGRMTGRVTTVVAGGNNQQINVRSDSRGSRVTANGKPVPEGGKVPRKVAAKAARTARDAQRQAEAATRESGGTTIRQSSGRASTTIHVQGENNSVVTSTTDGDHVQVSRDSD
ncbi:hypothetical protein [Streptomyces europaeiscabiei]|uniref:hypothetical protein n=1 Tax=Streptomyces europaeiscabiei TaxID=146819 RepID=UPI0013C47CDC|nr:hypothetical protein [Streptomyces europaeiscabiei]